MNLFYQKDYKKKLNINIMEEDRLRPSAHKFE